MGKRALRAPSALAFGHTLDYAVRKLLRSEEPKATTVPATMRLVTYFERGEEGPILDWFILDWPIRSYPNR